MALNTVKDAQCHSLGSKTQTKATMKCHFTPTGMAIIRNKGSNQDVKLLESSYSADWCIKWRGHIGKQFGSFSSWC